MEWNGEERRKTCEQYCGVAEVVSALKTDIAVMKTSLQVIEKNIDTNGAYKRQVALAFLGIILTIFIQIGTFSFLWGSLSNQVTVNTSDISRFKDAVRISIK
jgi:hypothetical protein